jgi:hypothetical protein
MPILGKGLTKIVLEISDVKQVLLDDRKEIYTLVTTYGSNCFKREKFKKAVSAARNNLKFSTIKGK